MIARRRWIIAGALFALLLLLASAGGIGWAILAQRKGDQPLAERRVPFGVFLCTAAFAAVPVWRWLTGR